MLCLMSGNVHANSGSRFPCSVCARNVTWRGRSVQCCTCSKWVHLRCSLLSFYRFNALGSFHSCSCFCFAFYCCVPVSSENPTVTSTATSSLGSGKTGFTGFAFCALQVLVQRDAYVLL